MKRLFFAALILYFGAFLSNFLVSKYTFLYVGKDDGLLFFVFSLCIFSSLFFLIIKKSVKPFPGIGFVLAIISYYFSFFFILPSMHFSMLGDHLFVTTIIFIFGMLYSIFRIRNFSQWQIYIEQKNNKLEISFAILFLIGLLFKYLQLPGANILFIGSLFGISVIYFPGAFYFFREKGTKKQNILLSIISGMFLSLIPLGVLFKTQHWIGGQVCLLIGGVTASVLLFITYFQKKKAKLDLETYYKNLILRISILIIMSILFLLIKL